MKPFLFSQPFKPARLASRALLVPLLLLLGGPVACGDDGPDDPRPDSGTPPPVDAGFDAGTRTDAGTDVDAGAGTDAGTEDDAGTEADAGPYDAGTYDAGPYDAGVDLDGGIYYPDAGIDMDAGTDGGVLGCTPSGWVDQAPDLSVIQNTSLDIKARLEAIPGLTVVQERTSNVPVGYRFFVLKYNQPADHAHPECQRFEQDVTLLHKADTSPMVLSTSGYNLTLSTGRTEPTQLLSANQVSVEHRFFEESTPAPADWSHLTIRQSADDFHRLTQALKLIYTGKWVSTGGSKGGETVVFFRRFYPDDVDATVAYVAPIAKRNDERFVTFQETVGGDAQLACRERLWAFQREVLSRRDRMLTLVDEYATNNNLTYSQLGRELALEHAVIETYFAFWQYFPASTCATYIPEATATTPDGDLFEALDTVVGINSFSDQGITPYAAYYYQAAAELGWPQPYEKHLGALIHFPDTDTGEVYSPPGIPFVFRPEAMPDIQDWVSTQGQRLMFIYGSYDPWTAAAYVLGNAQDSYLYTVPGGTHGSRISQLPAAQQAEAKATLNRWMGIAPLKRAPKYLRSEEPPIVGPHVPPRLR
ncbi:multidrug transporter [Corallococcus sp. AB049A]|uniref:S28 family serine protease n=1 Tax=Corallococcus sp. AB049A TaxID=2316721 RepID=UPI000EC3D4C0|nr:S28 family serine protease [Corallococcus sp. AB049A]RKI54766.1 multidrug transporter [Corallococcus sp. AB049A]